MELLNHFMKSSTVTYKRVAYKKYLVYWIFFIFYFFFVVVVDRARPAHASILVLPVDIMLWTIRFSEHLGNQFWTTARTDFCILFKNLSLLLPPFRYLFAIKVSFFIMKGYLCVYYQFIDYCSSGIYPVGTRYCGNINFLFDFHCNIK